MLVDDFVAFLLKNDIEHTTNDQSIIFSEAPCCGGHNKIYLFRNDSEPGVPFFGKCMKCDTPWNSFTYLSELGYELSELDALHGSLDLKDMALAIQTPELFESKIALKPVEQEKDFDISAFFPISEMPNHEASKYAISRGWTLQQNDSILIDIYTNSVVFVVRRAGAVVGYQKRFLVPPRPEMKVKSAPGFKKTQHIMEFPGNGPIMICEGPFTALSAWHYGYHAVCTFGAGITEHQIDLIADLARRTGKAVGVAFDLDAAGKKGYRIIRLGMYHEKIKTFQVRPEEGNDLNDSWKAKKGIVLVPSSSDDVTIPELAFPDEGLL